LGGLDAVPALFGRVLVPEPVLRELEAGAQLDDTARRLQTVSDIEVYALANGVSPLLAGELDLGRCGHGPQGVRQDRASRRHGDAALMEPRRGREAQGVSRYSTIGNL
jgi:hypothetical protein